MPRTQPRTTDPPRTNKYLHPVLNCHVCENFQSMMSSSHGASGSTKLDPGTARFLFERENCTAQPPSSLYIYGQASKPFAPNVPYPISTINSTPLPPIQRAFPTSCGPRWTTVISFATSLQLRILGMDMPCGTQDLPYRIDPWKSGTWVSYAGVHSIAFLMPYFPRTIHPTSSAYQKDINHLSPVYQIISTKDLLVVAITVRTKYAWNLCQAIMTGTCHPHLMYSSLISL